MTRIGRIAANWSPAMGLLERGLDRGAKRFGIPLAYIEVSPVPPS